MTSYVLQFPIGETTKDFHFDFSWPTRALPVDSNSYQYNDFWAIPTRFGYNYATLTGNDGVAIVDGKSVILNNTVPIEGINKAIKSFYWNGKYFIFWRDNRNYGAHTCTVIDLQAPGMPITTLPFKIVDAHVDELGDAYLLLDNAPNNSTDMDNYNLFFGSQMIPGTIPQFTRNLGMSIRKLNGTTTKLPYLIRTGQNGFGIPYERKMFNAFEIHSTPNAHGSSYFRIFLDGRYTCETLLTPSENPNKHRKLNIPKRSSLGYAADIEITGSMPVRTIEFNFNVKGAS